MPLFNLFKNCSYYWGFAAFVSYFVNHPLYTPPPQQQASVRGGSWAGGRAGGPGGRAWRAWLIACPALLAGRQAGVLTWLAIACRSALLRLFSSASRAHIPNAPHPHPPTPP